MFVFYYCNFTHANCINKPSDNWSRRHQLTWLTALMGRWISNSCLTRDLLHCKPSCHGSQVWCFWQGIWVPRYVFIMLIYTRKHFHLQLSLPVDLTSMLFLVTKESLFVQTFNFSDDFHHMNTNSRQFLSANTNRICNADLRLN